jgi:CheY-like chemotaxis protein
MNVERDEDGVTLVVELASAEDPVALERALHELVEATSDLRGLMNIRGFGTEYWKLAAKLVRPDGSDLGEPAFFSECAKHPSLRPALARYVDNIVAGTRGVMFAGGDHLGYDESKNAGVFAVIPLAMADRSYIATLIRYLRSLDLTHSGPFEATIDRLLTVHGVCDETLDLLAYWTSDGQDLASQNLWLAVHAHGLRERWGPFGGPDGFAERIYRQAEGFEIDSDDPSVSVDCLVETGLALFDDDPDAFARWCTRCTALFGIEVRQAEGDQRWRPPKRKHAFTEAEWRKQWAPSPPKPKKGLRVLLVENHAEFAATVVGQFLRGFEVIVVGTVAEARGLHHLAQVALVDHDLDDEPGYAFILGLRAHGSKLPIIAISAKEANNARLVRAGANAVCAKADFARIRDVIAELLAKCDK